MVIERQDNLRGCPTTAWRVFTASGIRRASVILPLGAMTVTSVPTPGRTREITVSYLGELLFNAGFIDDKQKAEIENIDRQFRQSQARGAKTRGDEDQSPFKALAAKPE